MSVELRCEKRLHAILDDGVIEISCRSALCGHRDGVIVIHKFDAQSGEFLGTKKYRDPMMHKRKEQADGLGLRTTVRTP